MCIKKLMDDHETKSKVKKKFESVQNNSCAERTNWQDNSPSASSVVSLKLTVHHYCISKRYYGGDREGSEQP